jgi:hypothetical protein
VSKSTSTTQSGGIGFVGLLTIVFIVLKLTGVIAWSWWWVLAPVWISAGLTAILLTAVTAGSRRR